MALSEKERINSASRMLGDGTGIVSGVAADPRSSRRSDQREEAA